MRILKLKHYFRWRESSNCSESKLDVSVRTTRNWKDLKRVTADLIAGHSSPICSQCLGKKLLRRKLFIDPQLIKNCFVFVHDHNSRALHLHGREAGLRQGSSGRDDEPHLQPYSLWRSTQLFSRLENLQPGKALHMNGCGRWGNDDRSCRRSGSQNETTVHVSLPAHDIRHHKGTRFNLGYTVIGIPDQ
ncbi:hypothetical protein J6590_054640 [Homalodisca vitripennis]|nr:hypothetical protein J6590_054640 [Homalodisca vitripennis]